MSMKFAEGRGPNEMLAKMRETLAKEGLDPDDENLHGADIFLTAALLGALTIRDSGHKALGDRALAKFRLVFDAIVRDAREREVVQ